MKFLIKSFLIYLFLITSYYTHANSEIVKQIEISGNQRIPDQTVLMFSDINIGDDISDANLNKILKNIYNSNFFKNVTVELKDGLVLISVDEEPLIQNITYTGIKAKKHQELISEVSILKSKSSFNEILLAQDIESIKSQLKFLGFYFATVVAQVETLDNNLINIEYLIDIGDKSKISKISFIGDKIFKDKELKNIIVSEEYKFWKFISGKKFLQEQLINLDTRLLKNFYLNQGFFNAKINSSFARLVGNNDFELIFNIQPGSKIFFNDLNLVLPVDFNKDNYQNLNNLLKNLKGEPYSLNTVDDILNEVDDITILEEFSSVNASIEEEIQNNKLNINFIIEETEKFYIEKINISGNLVTRENVIRNQFEVDEGDPYSEILVKKSENNVKSLNFFKKVESEIVDGKTENSKIININVQEKPTGEVTAGAGVGTDGGSFQIGLKENNYLGKGMSVDVNGTIASDSFKGKFTIINPNYKNSDKSVHFNLQALETDLLKESGYKTNKTGLEIGTSFEYLDDFDLGISSSLFVEKIETGSTASAQQKKQSGNYLDNFLNLNFNYDKRNQKYKASDGYISNYNVKLPIISDNNTLTNAYKFKVFSELYEDNITSFSILLKNSFSLTNDDVKLSERLFLSSSNLRGFESGKVGPKDSKDFIGGNYLTAINMQSTLPMFFENSQNIDAILFVDAANLWGIDYNSAIDDSSKIRSSVGIGIDWLTLVGPLNFSLSHAISKKDTDKLETFRFNLGTTF